MFARPHQMRFSLSQSGLALVVSLIFLLILTLLGLSSSNVSVLQERMASNVGEYNIAFQRAEATIREVEEDLRQDVPTVTNRYVWGDVEALTKVSTSSTVGGVNDCSLEANFADDWDALETPITWAAAPTTPDSQYFVIELSPYADDANNPRISCRQEDGLVYEDGTPVVGDYYLIVARAFGPGAADRRAQAIVQSVFWWPEPE